MKLTETQEKIIEDYTDLYFSLRGLVNYLKPTKELMNDEFRDLLTKAEQAIEKAKP